MPTNTTSHPHGACQCTDHCRCVQYSPGPAAYVVERDGRTLRVCTSCLYPYDVRREILATATELPLYADYDEMGTRMLIRALDKASGKPRPLLS